MEGEEIDYKKVFTELKNTSNERVFSTCKYCLPEALNEEVIKETALMHGIEIIYLSCDKHNPYAFGV